MKIEIKNYNSPQLLDFKKVGSSSLGYISIAEELPFEIKRAYWTYYAPHEVIRGHHAHKELKQLIFAVSGSIKFELENVLGQKFNFVLDSPDIGLYIPKLHWRTMQ
ncbi:FdtA/QdtA family cupin domain-containing protein, partial [Algoriphagus sp. A40]|uniref:sugar 3,4-ketoisomerase n=1 Tax=Algoriphagus sp. A40 TaxID=1945863 RepID=UPI0009CEDB5C